MANIIRRILWRLFNDRQKAVIETWLKHRQRKQTDQNTTT